MNKERCERTMRGDRSMSKKVIITSSYAVHMTHSIIIPEQNDRLNLAGLCSKLRRLLMQNTYHISLNCSFDLSERSIERDQGTCLTADPLLIWTHPLYTTIHTHYLYRTFSVLSTVQIMCANCRV